MLLPHASNQKCELISRYSDCQSLLETQRPPGLPEKCDFAFFPFDLSFVCSALTAAQWDQPRRQVGGATPETDSHIWQARSPSRGQDVPHHLPHGVRALQPGLLDHLHLRRDRLRRQQSQRHRRCNVYCPRCHNNETHLKRSLRLIIGPLFTTARSFQTFHS